MPRRFGFGLGFNIGRLLGLPEPSGFVAKYLSYYVDDFTLVTGSNVSQWDDISANANHLTQGTSTNQPVLVENDLLKQSTLANMPTLTDTGGGVLAMDFDTNDYMEGLPPQTGDFTYVFKGINVPDNNTRRFFLSDSNSISDLRIRTTNDMAIQFDDLSTFVFTNITDYSFSNIILLKEGDTYKLYIDGSLVGQITQAGKSFDINRLGSGESFGGSLQELYVYDVAVSDVNNITETPVFELLPQAQYLRNDSNVTASAGDSISTWLSTTYNRFNNTVDFGTDDYMTGLPTQSGDFTYVFKGLSNLSDTGDHHLLLSGSSNITSTDGLWVNLNGTSVTFNDGAVKQLPISNPLWDSSFDLVLTYSSGTYSLYIDGTFESSVAGGVIQPINVGGSTTSLDGSLQELYVFDRALTQDEINWFSYLRDENNNISPLPPILPS